MKKLAILTTVLLLLASAGAGAWWFLLREPVASEAERAPPSFVTLPPMSIPVIRDDRVSRTVALQITLELGSADYEDDFKTAVPHLVDAFLIELHALLPRRLMQERGDDLDLMKYRLVGVANRVLGQGRVTDVLIRALGER